jgi:hypothetical protein
MNFVKSSERELSKRASLKLHTQCEVLFVVCVVVVEFVGVV